MKIYLGLLLFVSMPLLAEPVKYADRFTIESRAFGEPRELMVSLPLSYEKNPNAQYPVIYTVRGQLDLLGVVAAINMLDAEVPEFIVVGVSAEGPELIPADEDQSSKLSRLLHEEVVPHIQEEYRVAPFSILVGHSAAGKFVSNDWLDRGDDFSAYYAISPELHNGAINQRVKSLPSTSLANKGQLLVSKGDEGQRMQLMFDELKSLLTDISETRFVEFDDQSNMSGRVHTVMAGLRLSFENWRPSRKIESGEFEGLKAHYADLSERYGFEVPIPLETMKRQSAFHSASDNQARWQVASDIVSYALTKSPSDTNEFIDISDEMIAHGMIEGSKRLLAIICQQTPEHARCESQR